MISRQLRNLPTQTWCYLIYAFQFCFPSSPDVIYLPDRDGEMEKLHIIKMHLQEASEREASCIPSRLQVCNLQFHLLWRKKKQLQTWERDSISPFRDCVFLCRRIAVMPFPVYWEPLLPGTPQSGADFMFQMRWEKDVKCTYVRILIACFFAPSFRQWKLNYNFPDTISLCIVDNWKCLFWYPVIVQCWRRKRILQQQRAKTATCREKAFTKICFPLSWHKAR